jgi:E3 ubiquitin-protein ligase NEDD4
MQINAASGMVEAHHDRYCRFLGRLLGKALLDGQIVRHHLVRPVMKHILGWPVVLADLEYLDAETLQNLGKLQDMDPSVLEDLCLDFTVTENFLGQSSTVELVPDGANKTLGADNLDAYLEANLKFRLCDRVKVQLRELLLGFYECVPEALLTIFDFQQLELLLCGMPNLDIKDWMAQTEYGGEFSRQGAQHRVVQWFWEVVRDDFDQEQRARLLQFTTGTSGVPAQGFAFLQGNDGNIRKFTVNSISLEQSVFPRAHTCFNRIDLPLYKAKKDLKERLSLAIQMESSGFSIE